jgi:hypothetical protein
VSWNDSATPRSAAVTAKAMRACMGHPFPALPALGDEADLAETCDYRLTRCRRALAGAGGA